MPSTRAVLLYDGLCGFCDRAIQFIVKRDRNRTLQFAALQGEFAAEVFRQLPYLRGVDSLIFVQHNAQGTMQSVRVRSDAVIAIAGYLGGLWRMGGQLLRLVPQPIRDWGYNTFARHRFRMFGRMDACRIPSEEERARFLD